MLNKLKVAAVQFDPKIMANAKNLEQIMSKTRIAAQNGAKLVVFPECAVTGYMFASREEAKPYMETVPGPSTDRMEKLCRELGTHVIYGFLEKEGNRCFNSAALVGPQGLIGNYRKTHLPFLGIDRFLDRGDGPFCVYQTTIGNIGIHICYDCNFPEVARSMALGGADILGLPTNWPVGRMVVPRLILPTRAFENHVYVVAADRIGNERGGKFIGNSEIIDPMGEILAQAGAESDEIIYVELDLASARKKRLIMKPGEFELDFINDRRPELYGKITDAIKSDPKKA
jgi:5-aminopentanamidase